MHGVASHNSSHAIWNKVIWLDKIPSAISNNVIWLGKILHAILCKVNGSKLLLYEDLIDVLFQ